MRLLRLWLGSFPNLFRACKTPMQSTIAQLAVELRNWIMREFQAEVAVFETMGGSTFSSL